MSPRCGEGYPALVSEDGRGPGDAPAMAGGSAVSVAVSEPSDDPLIPSADARLEGLALGIDVGGTGVKAALVDLASGEFASERVRLKTPQPATPEAVADTIGQLLQQLEPQGLTPDLPAGCGLPGVVKYGRLMTAANIDKGWLKVHAEELLAQRLGRPVLAVNDADAAGIAEVAHGAAAGHGGTVLLLTIGTGIGSALFIDRQLVPNTEFGHLEFRGVGAETRVSGVARERRKLSWKQWGKEFSEYLSKVELYLWPDLIILGGGVSKSLDKYEKFLETRAPVVAAKLLNRAGIAGAALAGAYARRAEAARRTQAVPAPEAEPAIAGGLRTAS